MIYCVVPEALESELYDKLTRYYADDENVTVIVDRRRSSRRGRPPEDGLTQHQREVRDRRRARIPGEFPDLGAPVSAGDGDE
jgi:hypothetical protein